MRSYLTNSSCVCLSGETQLPYYLYLCPQSGSTYCSRMKQPSMRTLFTAFMCRRVTTTSSIFWQLLAYMVNISSRDLYYFSQYNDSVHLNCLLTMKSIIRTFKEINLSINNFFKERRREIQYLKQIFYTGIEISLLLNIRIKPGIQTFKYLQYTWRHWHIINFSNVF